MWEGEEKEIELLGAGTLCLRPWPLDSWAVPEGPARF